jgi:hypothetical protein
MRNSDGNTTLVEFHGVGPRIVGLTAGELGRKQIRPRLQMMDNQMMMGIHKNRKLHLGLLVEPR